jgi:1-acyl-sn-glycerol-3-phosphate acyltransferase
MAHQLVCLCPECLAEDTIDKDVCVNCHTRIEITSHHIKTNRQQYTIPAYYRFLAQQLKVFPESNALRKSRNAKLFMGKKPYRVKGYRNWFRRNLLKPAQIESGYLMIGEKTLSFCGEEATRVYHIREIMSVTTDSHYLQIKVKGQPFLQIEFEQESALKYELILRKWLRAFWQVRGDILEFQPRVCLTYPKSPRQPQQLPSTVFAGEGAWERMAKSTISRLIHMWLKRNATIEVVGAEHWDRTIPAFVLVNHHSALDPFIISAVLDYRIAFLTKSSAFDNPIKRYFLSWAAGIPTTRYQNDPDVVRHIFTVLQKGVKVGIFPEAERCWDGELQDFKLGVIKTVMASGMPVYCIRLENVFQFWPRWAKHPTPTKMRIVIHPPFTLVPSLGNIEQHKQFLESFFR